MAPPSTPLDDVHAARQALFGERHGRRLVVSYGDDGGEYRAAREAAGLVHLSERDVLVASGAQRHKLLQGLLSNDVLGRAPGHGCRAALLTSKGGVQALLRVLVETEALSLEVDADRLELLQRTLERHRVAAPVRFATRPTVVLALVGPGAPDLLAGVGLAPPPAEPEAHAAGSLAGQPVRVVNASDLPGPGFVLHVAPASSPAVFELLAAGGARPVGREALDALRIEALRPWYGSDVSEANLLHEAGLVREYHSPTKGCYLGQEIVARLEARGGNVNKALRGLRLTVPARSGDAITSEGREIGRITSAAVSPRLGPIALGYVQRGHFDAGTAVAVAEAAATVVTSFSEPT